MKNTFSLICISVCTCLFILEACGSIEAPQIVSLETSNLPLEVRMDPDPECSICTTLIASHCCCFVENIELSTSIDMHICGVIGPYNEQCNMDTGDDCYDVGNQGIFEQLSPGEKRYFCIAQNSAFSLYNANGSGSGRINVGCSSSYEPTSQIMLNLDYQSGGYTRYFQSTGCSLEACPY